MAKLSQRTCSVEGCGRRHSGRGYCKAHYMAVWRDGGFNPLRALCAVPGCDRRTYGRKDLCKRHLDFQVRTGRIDVESHLPERPGEEWRSVVGYEGLYEASNHGRVRCLPRSVEVNGHPHRLSGRELAAATRHDGYSQVGLSREGKKRSMKVHIVVARAFIGPRPSKHDVNHINADRADNRVANLEYVTRSENNVHSMRLGRMRVPSLSGEQSPGAKLTEESVRYIRSMRGVKSTHALAKELGVTQAVVWRAQVGITWRSVG